MDFKKLGFKKLGFKKLDFKKLGFKKLDFKKLDFKVTLVTFKVKDISNDDHGGYFTPEVHI